ncbi:alpha/beta fold hydrolase [Agromyces aureus]|uniref:alpha/beta fold hydrolase n=1 Tax=Agromyces aureus TaxID=453304 RepID=UPI000AE20D22|nr:alpha/beta hydrolase [Agromyces aureus]
MKLDQQQTRHGADLRFADRGGNSDLAVVFTHGAGYDHSMFDVQARALELAGYRVIVWDLRGHGKSALHAGARFTATDALDDLAWLIEHTGPGRPTLIGHSLGGNLSQAFVRAHPQRVSGLIVLDSTWNAGPLTRVERLGLRAAAPMLGLIPASSLPRLMARASAASAEAISEAEAVFARMPKRVFLDVWRETASLVAPDPAYRTPVPLTLIRGALDRTGNISTAMPRWAEAEGIAEHVVPQAGHLVTLDAPDATTQTLLHLLGQWHPPLPPFEGARDDG